MACKTLLLMVFPMKHIASKETMVLLGKEVKFTQKCT